jgi:hypothetical protein
MTSETELVRMSAISRTSTSADGVTLNLDPGSRPLSISCVGTIAKPPSAFLRWPCTVWKAARSATPGLWPSPNPWLLPHF